MSKLWALTRFSFWRISLRTLIFKPCLIRCFNSRLCSKKVVKQNNQILRVFKTSMRSYIINWPRKMLRILSLKTWAFSSSNIKSRHRSKSKSTISRRQLKWCKSYRVSPMITIRHSRCNNTHTMSRSWDKTSWIFNSISRSSKIFMSSSKKITSSSNKKEMLSMPSGSKARRVPAKKNQHKSKLSQLQFQKLLPQRLTQHQRVSNF